MTIPFTGGGSLAGSLARATAPLVARLTSLLGSDVTVSRATEERRADNSTRRVWGVVARSVRMPVLMLNLAAAQRVWGRETNVTAECLAPVALGVQEGDGIRVTAGPYTGRRFLVAAIDPNEVAGTSLLGLTHTREELPA